MSRRFSIRASLTGARYVLRLRGELDGSTACLVLQAMERAPGRAREVVVDLAEVTELEPFGVDVLSRGARAYGRGRPVRIVATEQSGDARSPGSRQGAE